MGPGHQCLHFTLLPLRHRPDKRKWYYALFKEYINYKIRKINKSEKRIGIISLISKKNKDNNLIIFDDFKEKISKTKIMNEILFKQNAKNALVIADKNSINNIKLSLQNIPNVKLTDVNHFSAFDVAKFKKIIFTDL